ncbi:MULTISPECIES: tripartite tricarboxylate transporter TctB family protein [Pseudomonadaceae]|uniref:Tripartite tricarboxylate transporter TctB family n=1 Tax=Ectopseudomonas oleovorans TaxID=301 RepID=A0A2S7FLH6_ECTOL|nr:MULTISPECIES: tripartite tricarboxylate transporter TctB family protein [Pseudomonas]OWK48489.1 Tripartite tricarboxylate transporter TctB family protein [Pseudomonas oleovorans subsp. oleovorans]PKQ41630.1 tripartite tricarboxylate transporter TctB family protein [Pseudomonas sp. YY-1]PPV36898.1 tripartite tricarboxylate transporter TctB family protein [Pseudomonas oleovorans]RRV41488.1 tripartite tricarboxylate transporter TctB family protein [Pseudomonas sp. o96-267]SEJ26468.1 Tripartite
MNKTDKMLVGERTFCALLLVFSLVIFYLAYQISGFSSANSPGAFPIGVALVMILSAVKIAFELVGKARPDCSGWLDAFQQFRSQHFPRAVLIFGLLAVTYLAAIQWVSFYVSTFLFLVLSIVYLRNGRVLNAILIAAVLLVLIYLLFSLAFSVYLP